MTEAPHSAKFSAILRKFHVTGCAVLGLVSALLWGSSCNRDFTLTPVTQTAADGRTKGRPDSGLGLAHDAYSFLVVVAHPDDETEYLSGLLGSLSIGDELKGALLCLTSGGKGGNRNGWQMDDALEELRERELIEAARVYGVDVLFARFADYGERRTPSQVFDEYWDLDESRAFVVGVLRALRPAMVVSMHPQTAPDSPAHRAASQLAELAVKSAADSTYRKDLGPSWQVARHLVSNGSPSTADLKFTLDVKRWRGQHELAAAAHQSQWDTSTAPPPPDSCDVEVLSARGALQHLTAGISTDALVKRRPAQHFQPKVTRLYEAPLGRRLRALQAKRHQAFLAKLGPYQAKGAPAVMVRASDVPSIDGELTEFTNAPKLRFIEGYQFVAELRLLWHTEGLALGGEVLVGGPPHNDRTLLELYRGDSLELFLNARAEEALTTRDWRGTWDRQYIFAATYNAGTPIAAGANKTFALSDCRVATKNTPKGYTMEVWMPAREFLAWPPKPGQSLRFDFAINSQGRKYRYNDTTGAAWFNPHVWGLVQVK